MTSRRAGIATWVLLSFVCLVCGAILDNHSREESCDEDVLLQHSPTLAQALERLEMIEQRNEERLEMIEEKMDKMTEARSLNGQGSESVGPVSPVRPGFRSETQSLFQGCARPARREVARQVAKERKHSARTRAIARAVQQTCGPDYLVLIKYPADATRVERTCCLRSSTACAGCAKSADERTCEECAGGFIKRGSTCVSCADSAGWASLDGSTCAQLQGSGCNAQKVRGQSSNEACCHCGGGHLTPTPFSYDVKQWVLGSDVRLAPLPRTADRYSLDEGCELAAHNLTLDASTGIVSVAADRLPPAEVFDLECTVTAHQSGAEAYSTVLRISMTDFTYGAPLLWFPSEVSESYAPIPPITTTTTTTTTTATTTTATTTTTKAPKPFILTTSQVQVQNGAGHTYQLEDQVVTVTFKHDVVLGPSTSSRVRARMPQDVELEPHMARTDFYTYDGAAQYKPGFICRWDSGNNNVIWFKWDQFGSNVWIHTSVTVTIPAGTTCQYPAGSNAQVVLQQRQPDEAPWEDFELTCAPAIDWLQVDRTSGILTSLSGGSSVASVDMQAPSMTNQRGASCVVTAWQKEVPIEQKKAALLALAPEPWSSLTYKVSSVSVTVGQPLPLIELEAPAAQGLLAPTVFHVACSAANRDDPSEVLQYHFDTLLSVGILEGHPVLEVAPDGSIAISPDTRLSGTFDAMSTTSASRTTIHLACKVWGGFVLTSIEPIVTDLTIEILDDVCWVEKASTFRSYDPEEGAAKPFVLTTSQVPVQNGAGHTYQLEDQVVTVTFKHDVVLGPETRSRYVRAGMPQDAQLRPDMTNTGFSTYDPEAPYTPGFICRWDSGNDNVIWFKYEAVRGSSYVWIEDLVTVTIPAGTTCKYPVATATPPRNQVTEVDCRATCRARGNCAFYSWTEGDGCKFHWQHEAGSGMTVVGKIPGCAAESTCMEVSGAAWHMSGLYCPAGTDVFRGVLYRKDGPTPEETLHLAKYHHNSDGALDGCSVGDWIFRKVDPTKDYIDTLSSGSSELHGEVLACSSGVRFVTVEGSCESRMNGEYIFQGLTQPGRPYYKQNGGSKWLFHDPKCKSGKSPRWIIGAVPPSTSRSSSLRSDGKGCTSFGYSDSDEALPREDGIWIMYCGERFKMDKGVSLEVSSTHISLAALPCSRPINLTDTDKDSALVFDDPGTEEAADYFLHPCDCIPDGWDGAPVSEEALDSVPSGSGNIFLPRPLALTTGDLVCPGEQLLVVHFQTQTESMESADCESRCKAWGPSQPCTFFWHGLQHGAMTCRLYGSCPYLVTEFGLEGQLVALPSEESCHVADPEACFASTLRRAYLDPTTSMASDSLEFRYKDLHLQCDLMLLLGGQIESCSRPTYRDPRSHEWAHKHQLPRSFAHGRRLEASCWHERYSAAWRSTTSSSSSKNTLICMNGQWLDSFSKPNLGDFGCHACLQIGFSGYKQVARKNMQELWFVGRHHMALFTEIASPGRSEINCLESRGSEFEPRKGRWVLGAKSQSCNSACQDEPGVGECMPEEMAKIDSAENFNAALQTLGLKCEPGGGPRDYAGVPFVDYAGRCYYWENPGVLPSCGDNAFNSPQEPLCYCRVRSCTATVRVESTSLGSGRSQVQSLERPGFCLEQTTRNDLAIPELRACNAGTPAQQIAMADLGAMVWRLYSIQHATSLDGASGGPEQSLSCVGSGAVGRIPMRQLFGWTGARVAVCHFAPVSEEISPFVTVEGSCRSVVNGKYIFQGLTQPGRPYYKREGSNTFLFHDPACEPGAAPSWRFTGFRPSTSKSSDLDGRGCSSTAFVVDDGALPPTGAVWRSSCNLEWVESQLTWTFAGTVDLGDTESWAARLADTPVACGLGQAITSMTVTGEAGSTQSLQYTCGRVSGLGVCTEQFPPQRHVEDWSIQSVLGPVVLECPADSLFSGFEFEFSEGGRWARFRYTCCQAAGAPVAVLNRGALRPREDTDGLYCPVAWDAGRLRYQKQVRSEGWILAPLHWSCDDTCGDAGLQCKPSKIALVNSGTQVEKVMKDIGIRCASTSTDSNSVPLLEPDGLACSFWSQTGNPTCQGVQFPDRQRPLCYCAQEPVPLQMLSFHLGEGRWCLGQDCVQVDLEDSLLPIGLSGNSWDAVAVQDLIGTGPAREEAKAKLTKPRSIKNPKRPTAPKQPDIEGFVPQQPLYSKECMDYGELWEKITETYTEISADAPETHENKLPTEAEDQPGKLDDHPCTVASKVTGVSGEAGGGDGSDVGPYLSYVDLDGCAARVINRGLKTALLELSQANLEKFFDTVQTGIDVATAVIPNMIAAPVGVGAEFEAGGAAKAAATAAKKVTKRISEAQAAKALTALAAAGGAAAGASNIASAGYSGGLFNIEEEDFNDCDPMQAEVDRLFCDIHCVRDAVIRGDRTIIRNLKAATDVTNGNMKKLAEWSVLSNRAETGWLAEKIDTTDERLSLQIQHLQDSVDGTTLLEAKQASGEMLLEIAGFAQAASFNVLSRATAKDALERFLAADAGDAGPSAATGSASSFQTNASRVASGVLQSLADLRGTLRSASGPGASRLAMLGAQFRRDAGRMHQLAKRQMQVLGMYRDHSNITRKKVQTWRQEVLLQEQHAALFTVDRIWWELRGKLDEYMETATVQVAALETSLATMASYEHCASSLHEVQQSYAASLVARDRGHSKLRAAWRESSRLLGELASVVVDGDVFQTFVKSEGCDSALAAQTMQQAKYAVGSMKLLLHRFEVGGLTLPDTSAVQDSAKRLQESFEKATAC